MMMNADVLLVEDDSMIARLMAKHLEHAGLRVQVCEHGEQAVSTLGSSRFRLLILDRMLPGVRGMDILRWLRSTPEHQAMPILMVTALGATEEKVHGLREGADDYLAKPFDPEELVERVKALLRRSKKHEDTLQQGHGEQGDIQLLPDTLELRIKHQLVMLRPLEFRLFQVLFEKSGKVRSREYLLDHVWGVHSDVELRTVDATVKRLRLVLKDFDLGHRIQTIRGSGYRYTDDALNV